MDRAECDLQISDVRQQYSSIIHGKDQQLTELSQKNNQISMERDTNIVAVSQISRAVKEAEAKAAALEERAKAADAAERTAAAAEARAAAFEERAKAADAAERTAAAAEARARAADAAEARAAAANEAERTAKSAKTVAETKAIEAEKKAAAAETKAIEAEKRATAAETKAREAEAKAATAEKTMADTIASKATGSAAEAAAIRQSQEATRQLAEATRQATRLQQQADAAKAEADRLRVEADGVSQASREYQTQLQQLTQYHEDAKAEITKLQQKIDELTASLSTASSTLPTATQQQQLDDLKQQLAIKEQELANAQKLQPCPSPVTSFGSPQNPSSCTPKDLAKIYPDFKKIFIKDPDTLFNLLLTFINADIGFYLQTYPINDALILVFIPLFTLFIDEKYSSLDYTGFDKDYNYQTINYITFKKIFNIYYQTQHSKKQQLLAIFQKLTAANPDILTKLHKIIDIILTVGLYKITGDTNKLTGGKKYLGGFNLNYTAYKNVYLQTCVNIYLYETKHIAMTTSQTNENEDKLKSIITFIMRFYMNTLPYYIHNLFYHISKSSPPSPEYDTFKAKIKEIDDTSNSDITEDEIYIKLLSALEDPANPANIPDLELKIQKLCENYYYIFMTCNDNSPAYLSHTHRNFFLKGGDGDGVGDVSIAATTSLPSPTAANIANIAEISFTNPYYLLNHVSMDLCLLKICYEEIQKELKQHSNDIFNDEIKTIIKTAYDDIKELIKDERI
jgi:hypothetical protein